MMFRNVPAVAVVTGVGGSRGFRVSPGGDGGARAGACPGGEVSEGQRRTRPKEPRSEDNRRSPDGFGRRLSRRSS